MDISIPISLQAHYNSKTKLSLFPWRELYRSGSPAFAAAAQVMDPQTTSSQKSLCSQIPQDCNKEAVFKQAQEPRPFMAEQCPLKMSAEGAGKSAPPHGECGGSRQNVQFYFSMEGA